MDPQLSQARLQIAGEIGADTSYFYSEEEKRFTGIEIGLVIGGAFLVGFLKGLAKKLGEKTGEKAGEALGDYIFHQIDEAKKVDSQTQERLLEKAKNDLAQQVRALDTERARVVSVEVEKEFVKVLSRDAPDEVSVRIAQKVRLTAVRVLPS